MALRDTWTVRVLAGCLAGAGLGAAFLGTWAKVRTGHWLDVCVSPQQAYTFCGSTFVTMILMAVIGLVLAVAWIVRRVRNRQSQSNGKPSDGQRRE
jgi:heme/copper-type cytochrome/quinol oxidase subunit 2